MANVGKMAADLASHRPGGDALKSVADGKNLEMKHSDYDQWQRKGRSRIGTRGEVSSGGGGASSRPESILDFSKLPIQIKSTPKFNVGPACNHKHGRAKSATHDAEAERQARERQKEINVLSLLIMARRKALESYKLREETLLIENSKMRLEIESSEQDVHKEVKNLLQKYERYRGAVSTLTTKFESHKDIANAELKQTQEKIDKDLQGLQEQVDAAESLLNETKKELATLTSYKDKEYPVRAMRIRELHKQIKYLAKEFKAEQDELERIINVETSKYTTRRDDRLREIQSQATDFAQDLMQEGVKDMAIHNVTMKKEIEGHIVENKELEIIIDQLTEEVKALSTDPKCDVRKQMFPHLYKEVQKCTPDMDVELDIPRHDWLPI
nr:ribonuclease Y-like [Lytechinus pictus]